MSDFNNITAGEFCDLQGISSIDRFVINKQHKGKTDSYDNWYDKLQSDYQLGSRKEFNKPKPTAETKIVKATNKTK